MKRYVLDATVLIEFSKGIEPTTSRVLDLVASRAELCISSVQITEFYAGVSVGALPDVDAFLQRLRFVPLTPEIAIVAGDLRRDARSRGRRLATPDAQVAALTQHLSATLLTNNSEIRSRLRHQWIKASPRRRVT